MENTFREFDKVLDGFFYFFGFIKNPSEDLATDVLNEAPAKKIKTDLRKVNSDYRKQLTKMREEAMCLEY